MPRCDKNVRKSGPTSIIYKVIFVSILTTLSQCGGLITGGQRITQAELSQREAECGWPT